MRGKAICVAILGALAVGSATAEDLVTLGNETALYKAWAKREEARAEYKKKEAEADRAAGTSSDGLPMVYGVEGVGKVQMAVLQFDNGARINVKEGELIDNRGTKVASIKPGDVWVKRGGRLVKLDVVSSTYPYMPNGTQSLNGMPVPGALPR